MREWIDEKIKYLHTKLDQKDVLFEPTSEFYEKVEKIDIIPPLDKVIENIDKNRPPYITFDEATKNVEKYLGCSVPKIKFHPLERNINGEYIAGKIEFEGGRREIKIKISSDYKKKARQICTILAHEIAHYIMFSRGITLTNSDENEKLTDLASIMLGLGKLMLNGIEEKSIGATKRLCYLSPSDLAYAYVKVNSLYKVPFKNHFTNLDPAAYSLIKHFDGINIKKFAGMLTDDIEKKCLAVQNNIDKIKEVYYRIRDNQDFINENIGSLRIEPSDGRIFVNLNNFSFQLYFEDFISRTKLN